jgi:anti-sigma B factor antagonist
MVLDLKIQLKYEDQIPVISLDGELDVYTYPKLSETLSGVIEEGYSDLVINLEMIKYIDSTGLGVLASSASKLSKNGGMMHVICTKPSVKKIFDVSGLLKKNFKMFDIEKTALENAKPKKK